MDLTPLRPLTRVDSFGVFIDSNNLYHTCKSLNQGLRYEVLRDIFEQVGAHHVVNFYIGLPADKEAPSSLIPLVDWLQFNQYNVIPKTVATYSDSSNNQRSKANFDVEITMDILEYVNETPGTKGVVLFTGDGDFTPLLRKLARRNVLTMVCSSRKGSTISVGLIRAAQYFIELTGEPFKNMLRPFSEDASADTV